MRLGTQGQAARDAAGSGLKSANTAAQCSAKCSAKHRQTCAAHSRNRAKPQHFFLLLYHTNAFENQSIWLPLSPLHAEQTKSPRSSVPSLGRSRLPKAQGWALALARALQTKAFEPLLKENCVLFLELNCNILWE